MVANSANFGAMGTPLAIGWLKPRRIQFERA